MGLGFWLSCRWLIVCCGWSWQNLVALISDVIKFCLGGGMFCGLTIISYCNDLLILMQFIPWAKVLILDIIFSNIISSFLVPSPFIIIIITTVKDSMAFPMYLRVPNKIACMTSQLMWTTNPTGFIFHICFIPCVNIDFQRVCAFACLSGFIIAHMLHTKYLCRFRWDCMEILKQYSHGFPFRIW